MQHFKQTDFSKEAIEKVGVYNYSLIDAVVEGGKTGIRLNKCDGFLIKRVEVFGQKAKVGVVGSQDGQCIQVINCGGKIEQVDLTANDETEDLLSIYGNEPETLNKLVIVRYVKARGRSKSNSSNHICIDGPYPPQVVLQYSYGLNGRCFLTIAGGSKHVISYNHVFGVFDTEVFIDNQYCKAPMTGIAIHDNNFNDILVTDKIDRRLNYFQKAYNAVQTNSVASNPVA
jgi:hypothetical protein